jgi:uncharacterized protein DUF1579
MARIFRKSMLFNKPMFSLFLFITLTCAAVESAQAQMQAPQPAPETKNLAYFIGSWTVAGALKPSPMGPGGKITGTETWDWMDGHFFIVSHSTMSGAMGNGSGLSVMGYSSDESKYIYNEFDSMGQIENARGTFENGTWSWTSDEHMGGQTMKGRYTAKEVSPASYSFKFELSPDGSSWTTVMEGTATKK